MAAHIPPSTPSSNPPTYDQATATPIPTPVDPPASNDAQFNNPPPVRRLCNCQVNWALVAKVSIVALTIVTLTLAAMFTGSLAIAAFSAGASPIFSWVMLGTATALTISTVAAPFVAHHYHMGTDRGVQNSDDSVAFLAITALISFIAVWKGIECGIRTGILDALCSASGGRRRRG